MSGFMGSISGTSKAFNDIDFNNTIEGIKTANYLYNRVKTAERDQLEESLKPKEEKELDSVELAKDIQDDMER